LLSNVADLLKEGIDGFKSLMTECSNDKITLIMAREYDADERGCILEMRIGKSSWL